MFTRFNFLVPAAIASVLFPMVVSAQTEGRSEESTTPEMRSADEGGMKPNFGALVGYTNAADDGIKQDASFGLELGFRPFSPISLAAQWQYTPGRLDVPGPKTSFNVSNFLLKGAFNFGAFYLGAKSGAVMNSLENETTAKFAVGPVAGFDFPVDRMGHFTLGAEGTYLAIIGENTPDPYSALGAMRYWF